MATSAMDGVESGSTCVAGRCGARLREQRESLGFSTAWL
jgi:hypothetical protein